MPVSGGYVERDTQTVSVTERSSAYPSPASATLKLRKKCKQITRDWT